MNITYYENLTTNINKYIDIENVVERIKSDKHLKNTIGNIRLINKMKNKPQYQAAKQKLPLIVFGAIMHEGKIHSVRNIKHPTNLIALDYDNFLTEESVEEAFNIFKNDKYVKMMYHTPGGLGLKVIVQIMPDTLAIVPEHEEPEKDRNIQYNEINKFYYEYLGEYFKERGIKIDIDENAKDISRCSFLSHDKACFYNERSEVFKITVEEAQKFKDKRNEVGAGANMTQIRDIRTNFASGRREQVDFFTEIVSYLTEYKLDITKGYRNWLYVGFLCKKLYDYDKGKAMFLALSEFNSSYIREEAIKQWDAIYRNKTDQPISLSFLDYILKENKIHYSPKGKNLFTEKLNVFDIARIIEYEKWEITFCDIKKIHYITIPNLNQPEKFNDNIIPWELSGNHGISCIAKHFMDNYKVVFSDKEIEREIYSSRVTKRVLFVKDMLEKIKTNDNTYYNLFYKSIETPDSGDAMNAMNRWFMGCFQSWFGDDATQNYRKFDEILILHDPNGGGFLNFVNNTMSFSDVTNPATGEIWMDRNLGATQAASSSTDAASYGDLYQWGRADEGHEIRSSGLTSTNATTAVPNLGSSWDGLFITESSSPYDWLTTQDNTLWQGVSGTNNPCPTGYRLPTEAEWEAERASWSSNNATGAFASPLKLPVAGARDNIDGSLDNAGSDGYYLSSNISGIYSRSLYFISGNAFMNSTFRAYGFSVRCIKD